MDKVIITGANGFVGSHLVKELSDNNIEVIAIVRNEKSDISSLKNLDNLKIIYCDLQNIDNLTKKIEERYIDVFYHLAWDGSAGEERSNEKLQMKNALWTVDCVKTAKKLGCDKFIGAGSIMENETLKAVCKQGNKPGSSYIYGTGKLNAHLLSKTVAAEIGIKHIWGTITNAYGPGEISPRFINTTLRKILNKEKLEFTSATQNYDFIYISDVAKAFYYLGESGKEFNNYVIGSSNAKQLKKFIIEMRNAVDKEAELNFGDVPFTGVDLPIETFNADKIKSETGFEINVSFQEGIKRTMNWIKKMEAE